MVASDTTFGDERVLGEFPSLCNPDSAKDTGNDETMNDVKQNGRESDMYVIEVLRVSKVSVFANGAPQSASVLS